MSNPLLQKSAEDIITLVSEQIEQLKAKPSFGPNEARMLEIYNKIVTVCMDREKNRPTRSAFAEVSDDELSAAFE